MKENNIEIEYLFLLEDHDLKQNFIDSNSDYLKNNLINILTYLPIKGKRIIDNYELAIYRDNSYLLIEMITERKDRYNRSIPIICILSFKNLKEKIDKNNEIWNKQIDFIKDRLIKFSNKIGYPISQEIIDENFDKIEVAMTTLLTKKGINRKIAIIIAMIIAGLLGFIIVKKIID